MAQIDFKASRSMTMAIQNPRTRTAQAGGLLRRLRQSGLPRFALGLAGLLWDAGAIIAAAMLAGALYHNVIHDSAGAMQQCFQMGLVVAILAAAAGLIHRQYDLRAYLDPRRRAGRLFIIWNMAFLSTLALVFLTKTSSDFSRGSAVTFYVLGLLALYAAHRFAASLARESRPIAALAARRIFLVGEAAQIAAYRNAHRPHERGIEVTCSALLREGGAHLRDDLVLACAAARIARPEDIVILLPWHEKARISAVMQAFLALPAALHLGADPALTGHAMAGADARALWSLPLARRPMGDMQHAAKRLLDIALAAGGLLALSPLLAAIALAIRLDSGGPVLFVQRRRGFNREPFRIFKFRSMTSADDGARIVHCAVGDARVTRIGKWLRRFNLDELPQLINVLRGDMSLVGPRPHALAHDHEFEARIALYARRHNVKPGITGWAQVNGRRGGIETDADIRERVEHDLHYIDNWSLLLDLRILALTLFSPKAYRNAR